MVVVITGASGHLGANLVRALLENGRHVRALVHKDRRALTGLDVETVAGDICEPDSLYRAFNGAETVYHLAANISLMMNDWTLVKKVNVDGTQNVIDACVKCKVKKLIYFSSIHAIEAAPDDTVINETCSLAESKDCPPYDLSKAAGERLIRSAVDRGLNAVIVNPTAIVGPYDYQPSHFGSVLTAIANRKLPALIKGGYDWVDARDVARGAMDAEAKAPAGAKYLLSGHYVSVSDVAAMIETITGSPTPQFITPMWLAQASAPIVTCFNRVLRRRQYFTRVSLRALRSNRYISHEKATRELGYNPRPFRDSLVDTLRWFQKNGNIPASSIIE